MIFNYLHDKDVFEKFYNRYLGKRLLGHSSASDENEKLIVTKLEVKKQFIINRIIQIYIFSMI